MANLWSYPFFPVAGDAPAFNSTLGSTAALYALESTARQFAYPTNRVVRVGSKAADDFHVLFGSSTAIATSSGAILVLGGVTETFHVDPKQTHISIVGSSTDVSVNVALGHGGY